MHHCNPDVSHCTGLFNSAEDPEQFFQLVANFQSGRLDDQRVTLRALPGIQNSSTGTKRENNKTLAPKITLTPASPAAPKKVCSSPSSPTLSVSEPDTPVRPPLRSASFSPERLLHDDLSAQVRDLVCSMYCIYFCLSSLKILIKLLILIGSTLLFYRYRFRFPCASLHIR